jgi:hypothetical protein
MSTRTVASFGAIGDSVHDDYPAIQTGLDKLQRGDTLTFAGTKTYRLSKGLMSYQSDIQIQGNGATLLLDTSNYPDNTHLRILSKIFWQAPTEGWSQHITEGWFTLVSMIMKWTWIALGTDPFDGNEEHYGQLIAPGTTRIYIPHDINGTDHKLYTVQRLCERVTVSGFRLKTMPGKVADMNLCIDTANLVNVTGIRGNVTIGIQLINACYVNIQDVVVNLTYLHMAAGRALSAWQSRYVNVRDMMWTGNRDPIAKQGADGVFMESWCHDFNFANVSVTREVPNLGWGSNFPIYFVTGGCVDVTCEHTTIYEHPTTQAYLYDSGGAPDQHEPRFDTVEIMSGRMEQYDEYIRQGWMHVGTTTRPTLKPAPSKAALRRISKEPLQWIKAGQRMKGGHLI